MHQVSLETICPLKAFQLHYCPDNDAKSIVKHFIFLHKFSVLYGFNNDLRWNNQFILNFSIELQFFVIFQFVRTINSCLFSHKWDIIVIFQYFVNIDW